QFSGGSTSSTTLWDATVTRMSAFFWLPLCPIVPLIRTIFLPPNVPLEALRWGEDLLRDSHSRTRLSSPPRASKGQRRSLATWRSGWRTSSSNSCLSSEIARTSSHRGTSNQPSRSSAPPPRSLQDCHARGTPLRRQSYGR